MPAWSTRLFSEYVVSQQDANLSGSVSFTIVVAGNDLLTPQSGTASFTIQLVKTTERLIDAATSSFTLVASGVDAFKETGTNSFIVFPQGAGQVTDLKTVKDRLYNVTIK